ncbi:Uncharacterised protein [Salmonella enterica subsp. arizonae]|uniref:Uncharacterized protein n=1 Tax=Salmonella enterica subsp. arizonae TaxID=59203 RepID=A0A379TDE2_SALER|nr:Uncharacterised protein [Salmonella enterica subsp. arizonae]
MVVKDGVGIDIKRSSYDLTNVKKDTGLGITSTLLEFYPAAVYILPRNDVGYSPLTNYTMKCYCFFIQYLLLAIFAVESKITHLPAHTIR